MRAIEKKRPPLMTPKRWLFVTIVAVAALVTSCIWYYFVIQRPIWDEKNVIINEVHNSTEVTDIQEIHKYIWDDTSWIVQGTTEDEQSFTIVIRDGMEPILTQTSSILTKEAMQQQLEQNADDSEIKILQLGFVDGQLIWEVHKLKNDRMYYTFYRATDGQLIDEYQLLNKTGR